MPSYSNRLTCNFVNVYTTRYHIHVYMRASLVAMVLSLSDVSVVCCVLSFFVDDVELSQSHIMGIYR